MRSIRSCLDRADRFFQTQEWELLSLNLLQAGDYLDPLIGLEERARRVFEGAMTSSRPEEPPPGTVP